MKNITVVTTFHQAGLEKYGQRMIDSFAKYVDPQIKLHVYAEKCIPDNPNNSQITIIDAQEALPKLNAFKQKWRGIPKANGKCPWPERRPRDWNKEFKWDAVRFANKVYAVFDACEKNKDWVVWMDADSVIHSPWSYEEFSELLPNTSWITYVGRGKSNQTWPECGFYGLNLNDVVCQEFLTKFENMYNNAETGIFTLEEWHDSFVFGTILNQLKKTSPNVIDYTAELSLLHATTGGGGHPLINSKLGKWMDHLKGDRKLQGKSLSSDIKVNRNEAYWKNK